MRIPVVPLVFLFIFSFLIDWYILLDVKQMWRKKGAAIYIASSLICYALLIVAISLPRRDVNADISAVMWLLFIFLSIYAGKFIYALCSIFGRMLKWSMQTSSKFYFFRWFGLCLGLAIIAIMWIGSGYTRHQIEVISEDFYSQKLPASFDGYKIVQLSDLHVGTWGNDTTFIHNLVDTVNALKPDLIVFTGDIVNRQTDEIIPFTQILSRLKAKDGVYSILGNHDYGDYADWNTVQDKEANLQKLKDIQSNMGWEMLNNDKVFISNGNDSILLIGVENWGEPPFPQYGNLDKAISPLPSDTINQNDNHYKLLLSHNPEHWNREVSKNTNIDLTLSGHTHAMQAMIRAGKWKWSPAKYRYEQWGGRFSKENNKGAHPEIYVNIGAGAVGMPARLLSAYPEVTLITLKKGNESESIKP